MQQNYFLLKILIFYLFNCYPKYGKYADLQIYFSEKNIWRSSQVPEE